MSKPPHSASPGTARSPGAAGRVPGARHGPWAMRGWSNAQARLRCALSSARAGTRAASAARQTRSATSVSGKQRARRPSPQKMLETTGCVSGGAGAGAGVQGAARPGGWCGRTCFVSGFCLLNCRLARAVPSAPHPCVRIHVQTNLRGWIATEDLLPGGVCLYI